MGNVNMCNEALVEEVPTQVRNQTVIGKGGALDLPSDCKAHVCVVAYDYHGYGVDMQQYPRLYTVRDGVRFATMAKDAGAEVVEFYDRKDAHASLSKEQQKAAAFPTKQVVLDELRRVGSEMTKDEVFVFYFAGHGFVRPREAEEGSDEMMVLMESNGTPSYLTGSEVAAVLASDFPPHAHVLLITDCFHSGVVCDFAHPKLAGRPIVHLAAVKSGQHLPVPPNAKEPSKEERSMFTQALLETIESSVEAPTTGEISAQADISVVEVYNKSFELCASRTEGQDTCFDRAPKYDPDSFRWPLVPPQGWLIHDPLAKKQATGLSMFACVA